MKQEKIKNLLFIYTALIMISVLSWIVATYLVHSIKKDAIKESVQDNQAVIAKIETISPDYPDFNTIKGENVDPKIKVIEFTQSCSEKGCINNHPATLDFDGIKGLYKAKGKFSRAYLYAELLVDYERNLTIWDDLYFKMNGIGGHLLGDGSSLPTPSSKYSTYLYDLRSISYYPSIKDKERRTNKQDSVNFFTVLENNERFNVWVSLSSNRPGRVMREVSIYYECLEGSDCSIEEIK